MQCTLNCIPMNDTESICRDRVLPLCAFSWNKPKHSFFTMMRKPRHTHNIMWLSSTHAQCTFNYSDFNWSTNLIWSKLWKPFRNKGYDLMEIHCNHIWRQIYGFGHCIWLFAHTAGLSCHRLKCYQWRRLEWVLSAGCITASMTIIAISLVLKM